MRKINRGQLWTADLRPGSPHIAGKQRPVLILQADWFNELNPATVTVAPLTTQLHRQTQAMRPVAKKQQGLKIDSQIMIDQIRTIPRAHLGEKAFAQLDDSVMARVDRALLMILGLIKMK